MKSILLLLALLLATKSFAYKQFDEVTIGDPKRTEITSVLELFSKTKGFLAPRMTTVERDLILLPATGLQIYSITNSRVEVYNGVAWVSIGGSTLQGAYDDSPTGIVVVDAVRNTFRIIDNATPLGINLFDVQDNTTAEVVGVTASALNAIQINVDGNLRLDNASITAQVLNSDLTLIPNGTGQTVISSNLDVTGDVQATSANIDNLFLDGNTISSSSGFVVIDPLVGLIRLIDLVEFDYATATTVPYLNASKQLVSSAVTPTELGYVSGVTSAIQTQIDAVHTVAQGGTNSSTVLSNDLVMQSAGGAIVESLTTTQELSYLNTTTQDIQVSLDSKESAISILPISKGGTNSGTVLGNDLVMVSVGGGVVESSTTTQELSYLNTTTQDIQVSLDSKVSLTADQTISGVKTFSGKFVTLTTANGSVPCPIMDNDDRDAIAAPTKGDCIYSNVDNVHYQYDGTGWAEMGGGAGGGLDVYHIENYERTLIVDWTQGNNATFLSGGTLNGTFVTETVSPIAAKTSYKYTMGAASTNDYFASAVIVLDDKQKSNDSGMTFYYSYDGADDDIEVVVWDVTNSRKLTSTLDLVKNKGSPTRYSTSFYPSATTASIQYGFHVKTGNNTKILTWDDHEFSLNPFKYKDLISTYYANTISTGAQSLRTGGRVYFTSTINESGDSSAMSVVSNITDALKITAHKKGTLNINTTFGQSSGNFLAYRKNGGGEIRTRHGVGSGASGQVAYTATIEMEAGDYLKVEASSDVVDILSNQGFDLSFTSTTEHVTTPATNGRQIVSFNALASTMTSAVNPIKFGTVNFEGNDYVSYDNSTGDFTVLDRDITVFATWGGRSASTGALNIRHNSDFLSEANPSGGTHGATSANFSAATGDTINFGSGNPLDPIRTVHMHMAIYPKEVTFLAAVPVQKIAYLEVHASEYTAFVSSTTSYKTHILDRVTGANPEIVSLASNQFTLGAGKYNVDFNAAMYGNGDYMTVAVYNITTPVDTEELEKVSFNNITTVIPFSLVSTTLTITSPTVFEIRTKSSAVGTAEYIGRIKITKLR